jgi:hypothetical protein
VGGKEKISLSQPDQNLRHMKATKTTNQTKVSNKTGTIQIQVETLVL